MNVKYRFSLLELAGIDSSGSTTLVNACNFECYLSDKK